MNVLDDARGMARLRALGARSVPVVARGGRYVFAQVIKDVAAFLGLDEPTAPALSAPDLLDRYPAILAAGVRHVRQMPDERLADELPNRPRSWRVLMHHIFQIPTAFLDFEEGKAPFTYENLVAPPPDDLATSAAVAGFGEAVAARFARWAARVRDEDFSGPVPTYFGETTRHELLERTVWHSAQHVRQLASLLERAGLEPDRPLTEADLAGLPLTGRVWD